VTEDTITIILSGKENVEWLRSKVRNGACASETEAVAQVIASSREDEAEFERWFQQTIPVRRARSQAEPSSTISSEQVRINLAERRKQRAIPR
jgi:hypothetical protein